MAKGNTKAKQFFHKVGQWFKNHKPTKRRLIQLYAALLTNANIKGFISGRIYQGATKKMCVPGLNCYSCPGAVGACPLGALQDSLAHSDTSAPVYILGILALLGIMFGRMICGFFCPVGLGQELLYKIPSPKLKKNRVTRILSYFKYVMLMLVIAIPLIYHGIPFFCKYVCPAGTLEGAVSLLANPNNSEYFGMLGSLFSWKFALLVIFVIASVFIYRFFCRFLCPLGAIYGFFNKIALLGVKLDKQKCIECGACLNKCKMDVKHVGDHECINCGECIPVCPTKAIGWKGSKIVLQPSLIFKKETAPVEEPAPLNSFIKPKAAVVAEAVAAPVSEIEAPAAEESSAVYTAPVSEERKPKKPVDLKKRSMILQIIGWSVALLVLLAAILYYNVFDREKSSKCPEFTVDCYESASPMTQFSVEKSAGKATVIYYWNVEWDGSHANVEALEALYHDYNGYINAVAIHTYSKTLPDVQAFLNVKGWNSYSIPFGKDTKENNSYVKFGGAGVADQLVVINANGNICYSVKDGFNADTLREEVEKAIHSGVYRVGDLCPQFTLEAFNTASGVTTCSSQDNLGKVTVYNFWYTTCDPCKEELPEFNELYLEYAGGINMFAIHTNNGMTREKIQTFLNTEYDGAGANRKLWRDYSLTYALDTFNMNAYTMLGGKSVCPITVVVDADGYIANVHAGKFTKADLKTAIENAKNATH